MPEKDAYMSRRKLAALILLKMMDTPGAPQSKVRRAVQYADDLIRELRGGRRSDSVDDGAIDEEAPDCAEVGKR